MNAAIKFTPRSTLCPGQPTVDEMEREIARRRAVWSARAQFSKFYAIGKGWPMNPAWLSREQVDEIHEHPQHVDPMGCAGDERLFELGVYDDQ